MLELILYIAVIGLVVWGIQTVVPMPDKLKQIINVLAIIGSVLLVLDRTGLLHTGVKF